MTISPNHDILFLLNQASKEEDMKGSIDQYKPGCWRVRIYFNGKRLQIYHEKDGRTFEGPKGAVATQVQITREIEEKTFDPSEWGRAQTFFLRNAYEVYTKTKQCSLETKCDRDNKFLNHILPELGNMDMREIRTVHVNKLYGILIAKNLKPNTIKGILSVIKATFNYNNIQNKDLRWPKVEIPESPIAWLTVEQQEAVFNYLEERDKPIFRFLQATGCRPSEACALQRGDVNWEQGTVTIQRNMGMRKRLIPTKSKKIRVVPLDVLPAVLLTQIRKSIVISSFIFIRGKIPYCAQKLRYHWRKANRKANKELGIPITLLKNSFRHSLGCQLINRGVPIEAISKMLGHSSIQITQSTYAKILPEVAWGWRKIVEIKEKKAEER